MNPHSGQSAVSIRREALNRRRRVIMHEDGNMPFQALGMNLEAWLTHRFDHVDRPDSPIDAICWDIGLAEDTYALYDSRILPLVQHPGLRKWRDQGVDWVGELVRATHERGLECFWSHRVCPVDFPQPWLPGCPHDDPRRENPLKRAHPDWVNPCWWPQGLWNLASGECRRHKADVLDELVELYAFDGVQLDFARHTPCLPPGREWEERGHATSFVREVRGRFRARERVRGRPLLLAARVPENLAGCRLEGFEVERWVREELVDILLLGGRTSTVDLAGFRELTAGTGIKLCPSFDGHHTDDGYYFPPAAHYRGVFGNWWRQGADSIAIFNWACAAPETYDRLHFPGFMKCPSQTEVLAEMGSLQLMRGKGKCFAVERRGGYPWAANYFYRNDDKPLPAPLPGTGCEATFPIYLHDPDVVGPGHAGGSLRLRVVLRGAPVGTVPEVRLNGDPLQHARSDPTWQDGQIYGAKPQPSSGAWRAYPIDPEAKLLMAEYAATRSMLIPGENCVSLRLPVPGGKERPAMPVVEKIELWQLPGR